VFAICSGAGTQERVTALVGVATGGLVLLGIAVAALRLLRGENASALGTYVVAAVAGALVVATPGGLGGANADYVLRSIAAVIIGVACGLVTSAVRGRRPIAYAVVGALGGGTLVVGALGLLVAGLSISGGCLG
jgi:hypothetical protein